MAEFIQKTDTLNQGREKLNAAITDAEKAKIDAGKAVDTSGRAEQIAQTAEDKADSVQTQFNQVIIEGDSSVEAAQARVDEKGKTHATLKARIDDGFTEVTARVVGATQQIDRIRNLKFDLYPTYYATLEGYRGSVMQSFVILDNGNMLMTQVGADNAPGNAEHFTINHLDSRGLLIDKMEIINGGHGTNVQAYLENDDIVLMFGTGSEVDFKLIRITYVPDGRIDLASDSYEELPKYSLEYQTLAIDRHHDLIAIASKSGSRWYKAEIYSFSAYLDGTQTIPTYTIEDMDQGYVMQGFAIYEDSFYVWNGEIGNKESQKLFITDLQSGNLKEYAYPNIAQSDRNNPVITESEGMFIFRNPLNGDVSVFVGVCLGSAGGGRVRNIYGWHSNENDIVFRSSTVEKSQTLKIFEADGYSMSPSLIPDKLSDVNEPGWYYFTAAEWASFTDIPTRYKSSGWWVQVFPKSRDGSFRQEVSRNTKTNIQYKLGRTISGNGVSYNFIPLKTEHTLLWQGNSRGDFTSTFELTESLNNFDYVTFKIRSDAGLNTLERTVYMPTWDDNNFIIETHNIPDSPSSVRIDMFEYNAQFNSARDSFTNKRAVRISIAEKGVVRYEDVDTIGIQAIIGVKL